MTAEAHAAGRTVRFGGRASRGVLLGLSAPRVAAVAGAFAVVLLGLYAGGLAGALWASPLWAPLAGSAYARVGGRTAVEWLPAPGTGPGGEPAVRACTASASCGPVRPARWR